MSGKCSGSRPLRPRPPLRGHYHALMPPPPPIPAKPAPPRLSDVPTPDGLFGPFGGAGVPDSVLGQLKALDEAYAKVSGDAKFWDELRDQLRTLVGRATPLHFAKGLTQHLRRKLPHGAGASLHLKREDLAHAGSCCATLAAGHVQLAARTGRRRIVTSTASGHLGVAVAAMAVRAGLACDVHIAAGDAARRPVATSHMRALGARVVEVDGDAGGLRLAIQSSLQAWEAAGEQAHVVLPATFGPHPHPMISRDLLSIIGRETKSQCLRQLGRLPDAVVAAGGEHGAVVGTFYDFVDDGSVRLIAVEAGGQGHVAGQHAAVLSHGGSGAIHGASTVVLLDETGNPATTGSIAAGLSHPGVGPELAHWREAKRVSAAAVGDEEAVRAAGTLAKAEGILCSLEAAHAVAEAMRVAAELKADQHVVATLCSRSIEVVGG